MKISLKEFDDILSGKKYIFHLHTNYTDGLNSVQDYFAYASRKKYKSIIFTEHVRNSITYNFDDFCKDIKKMAKEYPAIKAVVGVESKVLPDGRLDVPDEILPEIGVLCFACHSFPEDVHIYKKAFEEIFTNRKWKDFIRVWVHPGRFIQRMGFSTQNIAILQSLINTAVAEGVYIENNLKQELQIRNLIERVPAVNIVVGCDAHSIDELGVSDFI